MDDKKEKITWLAPEFHYHHKDISWYWLTIIIAAIALLISIWQGNLLFGFFVILAEVMTLVWAKQIPRTLEFTIDKEGVRMDNLKFFAYNELSGFHVRELHDGTGELILKTQKVLEPYTKIVADAANLEEIKDFLKTFLEEIEYEESLVDHLEKWVGF